LDALEDEAITGSPALADGKVTGKPFTVSELVDNVTGKVAKKLESDFLWYLLEFGILINEDEADGEDDDDEILGGGAGGEEDEGEEEEGQ
jgi:hypothetical protein